jgi:adenylylsulfate kinase-like enzyme
LEHCRSNDPTGLYAEASDRSLSGIPGVDFDYEAPTDADLVLPTHEVDFEEGVNRILTLLRSRGILR